MRSSKTLAIIAACILPASASAQSDFRDFGTQCYVGSFKACASVSISFAPADYFAVGDATQLFVRIANRQGAPGFEYSGFTYFVGLKLQNLFSDWDFQSTALSGWNPYTGTLGGDATGVGNGYRALSEDRESIEFQNGAAIVAPFFGCSIPQDVLDSRMYPLWPDVTCGDRWITWRTVLPGKYAVTDETNVEFAWREWGQPNEIGHCVTDATCVTVTPEPATLLLFGTGFAAAALVRRRRRTSSRVLDS